MSNILTGPNKQVCTIIHKEDTTEDNIAYCGYSAKIENYHKFENWHGLMSDMHNQSDPHLTWHFDYTYGDKTLKDTFGNDWSQYADVKAPYPSNNKYMYWNFYDGNKVYGHTFCLDETSYKNYIDCTCSAMSAGYLEHHNYVRDIDFIRAQGEDEYGIIKKYPDSNTVSAWETTYPDYTNSYPIGRLRFKLSKSGEIAPIFGTSEFHTTDSTNGEIWLEPAWAQMNDKSDAVNNHAFICHPSNTDIKIGIEYIVSGYKLDEAVTGTPVRWKQEDGAWRSSGPYNFISIATKGLGNQYGGYGDNDDLVTDSFGFMKFYNLSTDNEHVKRIGRDTYLIHDDSYYTTNALDRNLNKTAIGNQMIGYFCPYLSWKTGPTLATGVPLYNQTDDTTLSVKILARNIKFRFKNKPTSIPPNTIRCRFSINYTPTMGSTQTCIDETRNIWDITSSSNNWSSLFEDCNQLLEVVGANSSNITHMNSLFANCLNLTYVANFDTSNVIDVGDMFWHCNNLKLIPRFNFNKVEKCNQLLGYCTSLTHIPDFRFSSVLTVARQICVGCKNVKYGALTLYKQLSGITALSDYSSAFKDCGIDNIYGTAELEQIPSDWK